MTSLLRLDGIFAILLLAICTAYYAKPYMEAQFDKNSPSAYKQTLWKLARLGERLSPWISISLLVMGIKELFL